ncbi:MAG: protein TolR [Gammaproteobacteria bacterium]|nr:protein TolR [Gammaproteobacteria bacterium]MCY4211308.1 protein TolR [Gammaproteobacteria bacterium]MCY4282668.1 protein TolR [Gammaproteobacteria bacterium]
MRARLRKRPVSEINVVPYIDVMLVLLIIFMITAPLLSQGVKIDLPQVPSEPLPASDTDPVIVSVDAAGNFFINYGENQDQPVAPEVLVNRVSALVRHRPKLPVLVKGDTSVNYGRVVQAMALLQGAGAQGIGLITEPPEQSNRPGNNAP